MLRELAKSYQSRLSIFAYVDSILRGNAMRYQDLVQIEFTMLLQLFDVAAQLVPISLTYFALKCGLLDTIEGLQQPKSYLRQRKYSN